jgi:hypothetical protein
LAAPEVDVGWCEVGDAFVVSQVVVVVDEGFNLPLQITWETVVFKQDAVFESLSSRVRLSEKHSAGGAEALIRKSRTSLDTCSATTALNSCKWAWIEHQIETYIDYLSRTAW